MCALIKSISPLLHLAGVLSVRIRGPGPERPVPPQVGPSAPKAGVKTSLGRAPAGPGPEIRGTRTEVSKSLTRLANLRPLTAARTETPKTPTKHQPPPAPRKKRRAQRALSRPGPGASHKLAFDSVTVGDQRVNPRNPQPRRREAVTAVAVAAVIALATLLSYAVGVVARHILRVVVHQR